jgi:hypothetical protein
MLEAFPQGVQGAGADVAVNDAERENCEFCETAAARVSFYVSTDLRDLLRLYRPTAHLVASDLGISASEQAFARSIPPLKKTNVQEAYRLR